MTLCIAPGRVAFFMRTVHDYHMNTLHTRKALFIVLTVFLLQVFVVNTATAYTMYTPYGFLEMLLERGIIAQEKSEKAKELLSLIQHIETIQKDPVEKSYPNAEFVTVTASQYIQHGDLTYNQLEDIAGLLLVVQNSTDKPIMLEAKRGCQVTYAIYDESNVLVYDSAETKACQTDERVTYLLESNASRMFEVTHRRDDHALSPGTYEIVLTYEGYGEGARVVSVQ